MPCPQCCPLCPAAHRPPSIHICFSGFTGYTVSPSSSLELLSTRALPLFAMTGLAGCIELLSRLRRRSSRQSCGMFPAESSAAYPSERSTIYIHACSGSAIPVKEQAPLVCPPSTPLSPADSVSSRSSHSSHSSGALLSSGQHSPTGHCSSPVRGAALPGCDSAGAIFYMPHKVDADNVYMVHKVLSPIK